ncbi:hypothetical protein KKI95_04300 [Xenorhabdus bovienii]|uniref:hypothetical protein n=1 Tax=Xenorhabdus bovienii TaxID=40576 RepID=UPI0023B2D906|nr:hypothetical protein [Xenorhabdus bovienii]MDE9435180.1 hypothetical protein [Xenorhabdus bovienii]MDE9496984.1 hypothetical protein [Xenorhabdus bovienii]
MSQYIVTYNVLGNENSIFVSSQIALDFDWSNDGVSDFLIAVENEALTQATGFNKAVVRIAIVRIYNLT